MAEKKCLDLEGVLVFGKTPESSDGGFIKMGRTGRWAILPNAPLKLQSVVFTCLLDKE